MAGTVITDVINTASGIQSTNNALLGCAKAWVNYDGTTSPCTIRASFNVSSVTKSGTGQYVTNFTTAFADANYSVVAGYKASSSLTYVVNITSQTTSTVAHQFANYANGQNLDQSIVNLAVFGNG